MILFFRTSSKSVIATGVDHQLNESEIKELSWLYGDAKLEEGERLDGYFVGPRREMITPWSTNAVEITQNMSLSMAIADRWTILMAAIVLVQAATIAMAVRAQKTVSKDDKNA